MSVTGPDTAGFDARARNRQMLSGNALCMASMLAWACGFPAAEMLLESWPPLALITARFTLAVCMLICFWAWREGPRALVRARWGRGTVIGGVTFGVAAYLLVLAQYLTDPVTVAIISASSPVAAALVEVFDGSRRMTRGFLLGLALSVVGGLVAIGSGAFGGLGLGALAAIASCFLFVIGSQYTVRGFSNLSNLGRTTITLAGGMLFTSLALFASLLVGLDVLPTRVIDASQLGLLTIYAVAGMALSQLLWIASIGRLGVGVASFHINVAPFYVMLLMLGLGTEWSWPKALGAAIVIAGVVVAQRQPRAQALT